MRAYHDYDTSTAKVIPVTLRNPHISRTVPHLCLQASGASAAYSLSTFYPLNPLRRLDESLLTELLLHVRKLLAIVMISWGCTFFFFRCVGFFIKMTSRRAVVN